MNRIGSQGPRPTNRRHRPRRTSRAGTTGAQRGWRAVLARWGRAGDEPVGAEEGWAEEARGAAGHGVDDCGVDDGGVDDGGVDDGGVDDRGVAEPGESSAFDAVEVPAERMAWARLGTALVVVLSLGLLIVVAGEVRDYLGRTQRFVVGEVAVDGQVRVGRDDIVAATGVSPGAPLMSLSLAEVQARVEGLPWVRRAHVRRELPNIVHVAVEEHVAVAILAGAPMWFVDYRGRLIKPVADDEDDDLPLMTGVDASLLDQLPSAAAQPGADGSLKPSEGEDDDPERQARRRIAKGAIDALLRVQRAHEAHPVALRFPLSELSWDPVLGITLISAADGAELRIGRDLLDEPARALTRLSRVMTRLASRDERLRYLLLDDPERPERGVMATAPLGERTTRSAHDDEEPAAR